MPRRRRKEMLRAELFEAVEIDVATLFGGDSPF
jgi:hypothetical protein